MVDHSKRPHNELPSREARTSGIGVRIAAVALAVCLAMPSISHAQTVDVPPAKATTKRAKAAPAGDAAQQAAPPATKRDPAAAQAAVEAGAKLLETGKTDQAVATLSSAISGGNLPPGVMAKALYLRGAAYRKQSKPALAISDLTSALWLKGGLSETDRSDATQQRTAAYSEAGLGEQGQAGSATLGTASRKRSDGAVATLAPDGTSSSANASSGATSSGATSLFPSLFGGGASAAASAAETATSKPARPQRQPVETAAPAPSPLAAPPTPVRIAAATTVVPKPPASAATSAGQFQTRLALVRTKAEADAIVAKLKVQHATALADKAPSVGETAFGNMGAFFQVRVGPFATAAEASALCGRLKGSGLDCVAINN